MEYVYAAMLLHKAGKPIDEKSLTDVLTAAGINADPIRVKALIASLAEVNIDEAIKSSPAMMPVAVAAAPAAAASTAPTAAKPGEDKKKKEEEEKKREEAAVEGLGALFG
jgi:large subunit ribosomal protein L12